MPVKTAQREYRAMMSMAPVTEAAEQLIESDHYVEGYATTFDDPYPLWGDYTETIDRNALDSADTSDVIMQFDHSGKVLARNRNGTLALRIDERGLRIGADLSKSKAARELYEEIKAGLIDRMSWAFVVAEDVWDGSARTILKVKKIYDVSAVSIPANDATDISARSVVDGVIDAQKREARARSIERLKLKIRIIEKE